MIYACLLAGFWLVNAQQEPEIAAADEELLTQLKQFEALDAAHQIELADSNEPGQRLRILGQLFAENGMPVANHRITFYQANKDGSYQEKVEGDPETARLRGFVETDQEGRFYISTILPGDYGSTANNRHIHTMVKGAKPENYDFYFEPYINDGLRRWAEQSKQAFILDLKRDSKDQLLASVKLIARGDGLESSLDDETKELLKTQAAAMKRIEGMIGTWQISVYDWDQAANDWSAEKDSAKKGTVRIGTHFEESSALPCGLIQIFPTRKVVWHTMRFARPIEWQ